nr:uncharacterized protein LOC111775216 [Equus caballus]
MDAAPRGFARPRASPRENCGRARSLRENCGRARPHLPLARTAAASARAPESPPPAPPRGEECGRRLATLCIRSSISGSRAPGSRRGAECSRNVGTCPPMADFWAEAPRPLAAPAGIAGGSWTRSPSLRTPVFSRRKLRPGAELGGGLAAWIASVNVTLRAHLILDQPHFKLSRSTRGQVAATSDRAEEDDGAIGDLEGGFLKVQI